MLDGWPAFDNSIALDEHFSKFDKSSVLEFEQSRRVQHHPDPEIALPLATSSSKQHHEKQSEKGPN
jgi:hypothetical protein